MVLQIGAHARQVDQRRDAVLLQQRRRPHARELQDLRRTDGARAEQHLAGSVRRDFFLARPHFDAGAALATVRRGVEQQASDVGAIPEFEVRAAIAGRAQKGLGRVPAPAAFLVDLEIAHALVAAAVEVVGGGNARLLRRLREGIEDVPAQTLLFHSTFAAVAVQRGEERVVRAVGAGIAAPVVFVGDEVGQAGFPAPGLVAGQGGPGVVVAGLAAHIDHAVDAAAPAQHFAARVAQGAAVEPGVGFGVVEPVGARVADAVQIAHRNVDPGVVVFAPGLDQQHALVGIGAKAVGQQAARGARADDDVVEGGVGHAALTWMWA